MAMIVNITESSASAGAAAAPKPAARAEVPASRPGDGPPEVPESDLSFWDILDIVNPLQHIPVVGSIYRAITGDEIGAPARVAGGLLYGGVVGLVASVASLAVEEESGQDPGGYLLAMLGMGPDAPEEKAGPAVAALPRDGAGPDAAGSAAEDAGAPEMAAAGGSGATAVPAPVPAPASASVAEAAPAAASGGAGMPLRGGSRMFALPPRGGQESGKVFALPARAMAAVPSSGKAAPPADAGDEAATVSGSPPTPAPAAGSAGKASWPPGGPTPLPRELIADAMMNALQKYERTARLGGRGQGGAGPAALLPGSS